jgi:hypothetical protein
MFFLVSILAIFYLQVVASVLQRSHVQADSEQEIVANILA